MGGTTVAAKPTKNPDWRSPGGSVRTCHEALQRPTGRRGVLLPKRPSLLLRRSPSVLLRRKASVLLRRGRRSARRSGSRQLLRRNPTRLPSPRCRRGSRPWKQIFRGCKPSKRRVPPSTSCRLGSAFSIRICASCIATHHSGPYASCHQTFVDRERYSPTSFASMRCGAILAMEM